MKLNKILSVIMAVSGILTVIMIELFIGFLVWAETEGSIFMLIAYISGLVFADSAMLLLWRSE